MVKYHIQSPTVTHCQVSYPNHLQSRMVKYHIPITYGHAWSGTVPQSATVTYGQVTYLNHLQSHMVRYFISIRYSHTWSGTVLQSPIVQCTIPSGTVFQSATFTHGQVPYLNPCHQIRPGNISQSPTVTHGQVLYLNQVQSHMVRYCTSVTYCTMDNTIRHCISISYFHTWSGTVSQSLPSNTVR